MGEIVERIPNQSYENMVIQMKEEEKQIIPAVVMADPNPQKPTTRRSPRKKPEVPKGNAQEIVEKLKDQIAAIEYIDGVEIKDLPAGGLKKELRDILIEFRKEIEIIKGTAINTIINK